LRLLREQGLHTYYWLYYQDVGVADAEYDRNIRESLRRTLFSLSGDVQRKDSNIRILKPGKGVLDNTINPEKLPAWLTETDLDYMTTDMANGGFRGGLNWYRNIDRNWELLSPWAGAVIQQPALFIAGSEDHIINGPTGKTQMEAMKTTVPNLQRQLLLEGAGHFVQQERPHVVNETLIQFLRRVSIRRSNEKAEYPLAILPSSIRYLRTPPLFTQGSPSSLPFRAPGPLFVPVARSPLPRTFAAN